MAKPELGTKRVCPDTGRKFYDLNHDPIVSPYTGKSYPVSFFEDTTPSKPAPKKDDAEEVAETEEETADDNTVSLEDAEEEKTTKKKPNTPDVDADEDDEDVELDENDNDTFLESDDDSDEDMSNLIGDRSDSDEET